MNKLDLNAYGVTELNRTDAISLNGGGPVEEAVEKLIGGVVDAIKSLADSIRNSGVPQV